MLFRQGARPQTFERTYRVVPMVAVRPEKEDGGKIIMPASALGVIATLDLQYPLQFEISNKQFPERVTHAGVLEFTAPEGKCYVPFWMMQNIRLEADGFVSVQYRTLKPASYVKLQPQSVDFLEISNPKAVLEQKLRDYSALTKGDTILFQYNKHDYYLQVLEIQPDDLYHAVSIVETDVKVDFAPPIGYKEPEVVKPAPAKVKVDASQLDPSQVHEGESDDEESEDQKSFQAFQGQGARINGKKVDMDALKKKKEEEEKQAQPKLATINAKGEVVYKAPSELEELRKLREQKHQEHVKKQQDKQTASGQKADEFKPFSGQGYRMR